MKVNPYLKLALTVRNLVLLAGLAMALLIGYLYLATNNTPPFLPCQLHQVQITLPQDCQSL